MIIRIHSILLFCRDLNKTAKFYKQIGFEVEKGGDTLRIIFNDFRLTFIDEKNAIIKNDPVAKKGVGMFIYFEVEEVDTFYQELIEKKIKTSSQPKSWPWGKREFALKDPDEYKLIFFNNI